MLVEALLEKYGAFAVIFFAIIGVLYIMHLFSLIVLRKKAGKIMPALFILVENAQDEIEGFIRNLFNAGIMERVLELNVIDIGSRDETLEILKRLSEEMGINVFEGINGLETEILKYPYMISIDLRKLKPVEALNCLVSNFIEKTKIRTNIPEKIGP
ncbi:hypothetical protein [Thermovenabulum sp.]|uniref:hypothetical protein n=1 Tax=Thermovenabulum sp. TaxID=3100335 RepID=UPI003C7B6CC6